MMIYQNDRVNTTATGCPLILFNISHYLHLQAQNQKKCVSPEKQPCDHGSRGVAGILRNGNINIEYEHIEDQTSSRKESYVRGISTPPNQA